MKKLLNLSLAFATVILLGMTAQSCSTSKNATKSSAINGTWVLTSLDGEGVEVGFKGKTPILNIDLAANQINGNGGCNSYTGRFTYDKGVFSAPNVAATMMMCIDGNKEGQFFAMLAKQNTVSVVDGILTFTSEGKVVATFVKGIDSGLLMGDWVLESINGVAANTTFDTENLPTINFNLSEKKLNGNSGCNMYNAPYTLSGSIINVGMLMSTRRACPFLEGEGKFGTALAGASQVSVDREALTFSKDGKVVLKFVKK